MSQVAGRATTGRRLVAAESQRCNAYSKDRQSLNIALVVGSEDRQLERLPESHYKNPSRVVSDIGKLSRTWLSGAWNSRRGDHGHGGPGCLQPKASG